MRKAPYPERLHRAIQARQSVLAVGLDPRLERLPAPVLAAARDSCGQDPAWITEALVRFAEGVCRAVAPACVAVKVNIAFFEQYHLPGLLAYPRVVAAARRHGLLVIGDVKRGDIRESAAAYARGHLSEPAEALDPSLRLDTDAVTVHAYLGRDSVAPFVAAACASGGGVYVLVRTSNPSSTEVQELRTSTGSVADRVAALVDGWGREAGLVDGYAPVGAVVGATFPEALAHLRRKLPHAPLLIPGVGAQGGRPEDLAPAFDGRGLGALVCISRAILFAYEGQRGPWEEAVARAAARWRDRLEAVRRGS